MNHLHHNKYSQPAPTTNQTTNRTIIDFTRIDTGTFGMPAQDSIPMQTYRDLWQLWIESRIENEQLWKRVMELEAHVKEAGNG